MAKFSNFEEALNHELLPKFLKQALPSIKTGYIKEQVADILERIKPNWSEEKRISVLTNLPKKDKAAIFTALLKLDNLSSHQRNEVYLYSSFLTGGFYPDFFKENFKQEKPIQPIFVTPAGSELLRISKENKKIDEGQFGEYLKEIRNAILFRAWHDPVKKAQVRRITLPKRGLQGVIDAYLLSHGHFDFSKQEGKNRFTQALSRLVSRLPDNSSALAFRQDPVGFSKILMAVDQKPRKFNAVLNLFKGKRIRTKTKEEIMLGELKAKREAGKLQMKDELEVSMPKDYSPPKPGKVGKRKSIQGAYSREIHGLIENQPARFAEIYSKAHPVLSTSNGSKAYRKFLSELELSGRGKTKKRIIQQGRIAVKKRILEEPHKLVDEFLEKYEKQKNERGKQEELKF
ncbi:hypothetical protein HY989_06435 [Candidatus Micrarchaeota archaeon]|nr:hypothetical protein [Candidatus Micrarchaeota archaeon]